MTKRTNNKHNNKILA